jgi:hypothetical protein
MAAKYIGVGTGREIKVVISEGSTLVSKPHNEGFPSMTVPRFRRCGSSNFIALSVKWMITLR